jgi:hypothetical protein
MGSLVQFDVLKGHDFSRAANGAKRTRALAPEGCFSKIPQARLRFGMRDSMKTSFLHLTFVLLASFGLASTLSAHAYGQNSQNEPAPVATEQSSPETSASTDAASSAQDAGRTETQFVPNYILYHMFFSHVAEVDKYATKMESKGKNEDDFRTADQKAAGLTEEEGAIMKQVSLDCIQALKDNNATMQSEHSNNSATASNAAAIAKSQSDNSPAIVNRIDIINVHIAELRQRLGDASFAKLDQYIRKLLGDHGKNVLIQNPANNEGAQNPSEGVKPQ